MKPIVPIPLVYALMIAFAIYMHAVKALYEHERRKKETDYERLRRLIEQGD